MKKTIITSLTVFLGTFAHAEVEISHPRHQPIQVQLTSVGQPYTTGNYYLRDSNQQTRGIVSEFNKSADEELSFTYISSNGRNKSEPTVISDSLKADFLALVRNASPECPLNLTLDRNTFALIKAQSPCDPYQ